jgi:hypothetical protein
MRLTDDRCLGLGSHPLALEWHSRKCHGRRSGGWLGQSPHYISDDRPVLAGLDEVLPLHATVVEALEANVVAETLNEGVVLHDAG